MDNELHRALAGSAMRGLAQLLEAADPKEEFPARGLAALARLIAEAADRPDLDGAAERS